ncbi:MAG: DUF1853 family protein, partial [Janthinobacterium lividum]
AGAQVSCQARFEHRWGMLHDPHVRALAWLIDAPGLLDGADPAWHGQIASLPANAGALAQPWLQELDRQPQALHAAIAQQPTTRLGRYAEKLMAFYFSRLGILRAHGLQVGNGKLGTVGEFDFLLQDEQGLRHWEFATKFYLLEKPDIAAQTLADYFIGPNLADTLGAKMGKILHRQLALSSHPAAQALLPAPVVKAQALVKGWLFYHGSVLAPHDGPLSMSLDVLSDAAGSSSAASADEGAGLAPAHCRGFWCENSRFQAELAAMPTAPEPLMAILPRLSWLAPARLPLAQTHARAAMPAILERHFATDTMPVMVALMAPIEGEAIEIRRGFIVPDDWRRRAGERRQAAG